VLPAGTMAQLVDPESAALFDRIGYGDSNGVLGSLDPHALAASTRGMSLKSCDPRVGRRLAGAAWLWSIHGRTGSMDRLAERMDAEPWRDLLGCGDYGLQKGQVVAEARI